MSITKTHEQEIADLKEEIDERDQRIEELEISLSEIEASSAELKKKEIEIEEKENDIEDLKSKIEEMENEKPGNSFRGIDEIYWDTENGNLADIQMMEALQDACEKGTSQQVTQHLQKFIPIDRYNVEDLL